MERVFTYLESKNQCTYVARMRKEQAVIVKRLDDSGGYGLLDEGVSAKRGRWFRIHGMPRYRSGDLGSCGCLLEFSAAQTAAYPLCLVDQSPGTSL